MLDIAYSSSTYCSRSLENQELPDLRAKFSNFDFDHFFSRIEPFWVILSKKIFFEKMFLAQNDSEWFNSWKKVVEIEIWDFRPPNGSLGPRLSHFLPIFKNEDFVDFFDFGWLDMLDIAYSSSTNGSRSLDNQESPDLRAKWCKMRPIMQKKCENLDFRLFFQVWVLEYAW